ncbi:hypothetical protein [Cohnella nanjingensis]|uniref:Uncharacterized protein n=1 Tax=Cohnella nanjingensis TaxID=1387779 RepID=A0A7X0RPA1_9BACL|nr:hypothetical protein [Cohnella nanjingensis]MBB6671105.1 hypothetical protein [Cohnella nanjingensis]
MNRSHEVEYCNLELRFDRRQIQNLIRELIQEGYSLYWNESEHQFLISVRTGRKLLKLRFQRTQNRYKMVGDYLVKDEKLAYFIEKLINDSRGHAVVKRFRDRQVLIENIMFGEIIRLVEVSGMEHRIIFQKRPQITVEDMIQAYKSKRAEHRAGVLRLEIDYELAMLHEALQEGRSEDAEACKQKLAVMRTESLQLEL